MDEDTKLLIKSYTAFWIVLTLILAAFLFVKEARAATPFIEIGQSKYEKPPCGLWGGLEHEALNVQNRIGSRWLETFVCRFGCLFACRLRFSKRGLYSCRRRAAVRGEKIYHLDYIPTLPTSVDVLGVTATWRG